MPEGQQTTTAPGIDDTRLGFGDDLPGLVPLVEVKTPHTVDFGIDASASGTSRYTPPTAPRSTPHSGGQPTSTTATAPATKTTTGR
ncbi:hypothetical protein [Streptomyces sp. C10-9-1]|uniref:hypothetical protein n=1 Tax=Streptomyces sp. C10-9-1 TaxID=1859285 RepID=UPI003F49F339